MKRFLWLLPLLVGCATYDGPDLSASTMGPIEAGDEFRRLACGVPNDGCTVCYLASSPPSCVIYVPEGSPARSVRHEKEHTRGMRHP